MRPPSISGAAPELTSRTLVIQGQATPTARWKVDALMPRSETITLSTVAVAALKSASTVRRRSPLIATDIEVTSTVCQWCGEAASVR
eukprot:1700168-Rhodomonas_salina.1